MKERHYKSKVNNDQHVELVAVSLNWYHGPLGDLDENGNLSKGIGVLEWGLGILFHNPPKGDRREVVLVFGKSECGDLALIYQKKKNDNRLKRRNHRRACWFSQENILLPMPPFDTSRYWYHG